MSNSVNTSFIERNNLTLRQKNSRLQRKTLQFTKKKELLYTQLDLFLGFYHFIRPHKGLRRKCENEEKNWIKGTSMIAAGITDHVWSLREFFFFNVEWFNSEGILINLGR